MDRKSDRPADTTAAAIADKVTTGARSGLTDCNSTLNRTLIRVSSRSINTTAESTAAFIKHYKWKEVSLVTNMGTSAYERMVVFETVLKRQGINITRKILFEESATLNDMISGGQLEEIRQNSKVVIVFFSSTRDLGAIFREASNKYGLSESEFVFIFPWLPEAVYGASPIAGSDTSILEKVKETYSNCVLIEDTNAFDDGTITTFLEKIGSVGLEEKDIDMNNIYGYTALFDAFKALAIAGRRILNSTGDLSSVKEGKKMWNAMRRMTFAGMLSNDTLGSGTVMLDDLAQRLPSYSAFFVDKKRN
ncbi:hypothetical protein Y032_0130g1538 [Ancylostoma ceylanicum]|uniref:Receptor ligand binding region domain-containing protein n=1 Tax=Ancylostoma ceylanicum TaxID=53326 RepID=A0A016T7J5_9BILA|nr:hypothetical protein Y032_0130g1538 [Ancylostoma ceylanicum]